MAPPAQFREVNSEEPNFQASKVNVDQEADNNNNSHSTVGVNGTSNSSPSSAKSNGKQRLDTPDSANGSSSAGCDYEYDAYQSSKMGSCRSSERAKIPASLTGSSDIVAREDQLRIDFKQSGDGLVDEDNRDSKQVAGLLYETREPLKLKDFSEEVRGALDVEQFVSQSELLLDLRESSIEGIVNAILAKVIDNEPKRRRREDAFDIASEIFVPGSSMLLAQTIQGVSEQSSGGQDLEPDQSWLCALCKSAQIERRHMAIARFKSPVNMGANAHQVKLFALILTPVETKGTKGPLETGRTFATMLADSSFRLKLMAAKSETEFKSLMILEAQQLRSALIAGRSAATKSKGQSSFLVSFKNRDKYKFDPIMHMSLADLSTSKRNGHSIGVLNGASSVCSITSFEQNPRTNKLFELINSDGPIEGRKGAATNDRDKRVADGKALDAEVRSTSCLGSICCHLEFGQGLWRDLTGRLRHYPSDFKDAFVGPPRTIQKTVATTWFLYFGILLPTIAFSSLNRTQTHGHMGDLREAVIGQAIGGLCFALLGGQPLVIIMTTAPLCLYTKVVHQMCIDYGFHFPAMYAAVGFWNGVFLTIYSLFGFSKLMRWCTRSTEEIFALFIVIAFISDASKDLAKNFHKYYYSAACEATSQSNSTSGAQLVADLGLNATTSVPTDEICRRETSLLFVLLMLGTLWLSTSLYKFNKTPYLSPGKRQLLADYALPMAVIIMSFLGSFTFSEIQEINFERARMELLPLGGLLVSLGLGFTLSLLFFMDQNISAAMVGAPQNKLKKGDAYHYDLLVVGILNGFLTAFGLPMMHGVLPHSPLHVLSLSDLEERLEEGHLRQVVTNCRETRVTSIVAHLLLLASLYLIPHPIGYIPRAVLNGLFLYMAVSSLDGLQIFERILLLFTEQNKYPPNHYIRRCPQRKIHKFTLIQLLQLLVMCMFGFSPVNVVEMFFPVIILLMIPFRHTIVPKYVDEKYLDALDGKH